MLPVLKSTSMSKKAGRVGSPGIIIIVPVANQAPSICHQFANNESKRRSNILGCERGPTHKRHQEASTNACPNLVKNAQQATQQPFAFPVHGFGSLNEAGTRDSNSNHAHAFIGTKGKFHGSLATTTNDYQTGHDFDSCVASTSSTGMERKGGVPL